MKDEKRGSIIDRKTGDGILDELVKGGVSVLGTRSSVAIAVQRRRAASENVPDDDGWVWVVSLWWKGVSASWDVRMGILVQRIRKQKVVRAAERGELNNVRTRTQQSDAQRLGRPETLPSFNSTTAR